MLQVKSNESYFNTSSNMKETMVSCERWNSDDGLCDRVRGAITTLV